MANPAQSSQSAQSDQPTTKKTIFSKIVDGELPATVHYQDDDFMVIDDIQPAAPVHLLIISKRPYASLEEVPLDRVGFHSRLLQLARQMAAKLGIADNYKLVMNVGRQVQQVQHLHLHLLGGWRAKKTARQLDQETEAFVNRSQ
ncbi:MAG: histidine triad nucleotide-binding protein [Candidatus Pacebacteria bacterium CG10_big_fil_rev_8_21_14_0_10_56_10]|nr:MAG: histidine triad nucleotide-binding protein [Candidatus Pacebacteria bacterium CG10_big_fil_rev_8_21_14_0_10_56_10]